MIEEDEDAVKAIFAAMADLCRACQGIFNKYCTHLLQQLIPRNGRLQKPGQSGG